MTRVRTKKVLVAATEPLKMTGPMGAPGVRQTLTVDKPDVRMVPVFHAHMKVLRSEAETKAALKEGLGGAFVKYMPTIRASERASVDTKALRDKFVAAGAVAVVIAPTIVPDRAPEKASQEPRKTATAESHLKTWFDGVKAAKGVAEAALEEALKTVGEAGL